MPPCVETSASVVALTLAAAVTMAAPQTGTATPSEPIRGRPGVATRRAVVNLRTMAAVPTPIPAPRAVHLHPPPPRLPVPEGVEPPSPEALAARAAAAEAPMPLSPAPIGSFPALGDDNTLIPPDTNGAVGPNHLMVALNSQVRVQDRTGAVISTVSLDAFWASVGGGGDIAFDPRVLFDPYGKRWIFTACDDAWSATSALLIGVSQTSDPTGDWNLYRVDIDPTDRLSADYPSLGFNKDWIVVQVNEYPITTGEFKSGIYVFSKADLYAGGAGLHTLLSTPGDTQVPAATYDNTSSELHLVTRWASTAGLLRIFSISGPVGSEVLTPGAFVNTGSSWAAVGPTFDFAPQAGTTFRIATNYDLVQRVVYRNGSLWLTQTVFLPGDSPTRSAVQWMQLAPDGAILQFGRVDDPSGSSFYAFPSIAVNANEDVLIGYARFSASSFASASYSFRAASDPPHTLQTPFLLKAGEAPYYKTFGGGSNRWGDYSAAVVDPLNDVDLWTIQEYAAVPAGGFDRWGTWWGHLSPMNTPPLITTMPVSRVQGSPPIASPIATVNDAATPAGDLTVTTTSVPAGISVTGFTNVNGLVTAAVGAGCTVVLGANTVGLQVTDGGSLSTGANVTVNVTPNPAPVLASYPATSVGEGASITVIPGAPHTDNGAIVGLTGFSPGFAGSFSGDPTTGVVTIASAGPVGSYTVTVTATDNCGASSSTTFSLTVCDGDEIVLVADGREVQNAVPGSGTLDHLVVTTGGRSYSVEVRSEPAALDTVAFFTGYCGGTGALTTRDTSAIAPGLISGGMRASFTAPPDLPVRIRLVNPSGSPASYVVAVSETTMYSPAWSTLGGFHSYYSFQNTTNAVINARLTLLDTGSAVVATFDLSVAPDSSLTTNTLALAVPEGRIGTARLTHDGPPGSLQAEAAIANFALSPTAYIQPVKFQPVREKR